MVIHFIARVHSNVQSGEKSSYAGLTGRDLEYSL